MGWGVRPLTPSHFQRKPALAAVRERLHSGAMANKNAFAIVAIALALIIGVIVGVGIVGTILLFLYGIIVSVFRNAFGIELPYPF